VIVWTHGIIGTGLSLLNHFPLFVVMLRFKDPARLPCEPSFSLLVSLVVYIL
jgi:phosphatidylinositol glycan class Q protein